MVHVFCPGEDVYIRLHGSSEEVDVHLEPDLVHLTQTYISLSTVNRTVSLINKHNVPLQYSWTTASSIQEEALNFMRCVWALSHGQYIHLYRRNPAMTKPGMITTDENQQQHQN